MVFKVEKDDWRKIGVYCITNTINNKIYIGSTTTNFRHRYLQYCSGFKRKLDNQPILYKAFNKYGFENFTFELVCICNKENTLAMEQFYIDKGVDYNSCLIAGSLSGLKHSKNSKTKTVKGGNHHSAKEVYQFDLNGEFIKKHLSVIEAVNLIGKTKNSVSHITQCCIGKTYSSFGYRWSFTQNLLNREKRIGKHTIKISSDNFELIGTYKEIVHYFKSIGFEKARVSTVLNALRRNINIYKQKIEKHG